MPGSRSRGRLTSQASLSSKRDTATDRMVSAAHGLTLIGMFNYLEDSSKHVSMPCFSSAEL
eukprot:922588-Pyramimonas_sp.AAC.1